MERKISGEVIYKGRVISLEKDKVLCSNGNESIREIVRHNGGSAILAIDNGYVFLEKQFRYAYNDYIIEIPAGKIEPNEDPLTAAYREIEEEIGYKAIDLKLLNILYPSVGYTSEVIHIYYTNTLVKTKTHLDFDEEIEIIKIPFAEAIEMIKTQKIKDAKTICALLSYQAFIK